MYDIATEKDLKQIEEYIDKAYEMIARIDNYFVLRYFDFPPYLPVDIYISSFFIDFDSLSYPMYDVRFEIMVQNKAYLDFITKNFLDKGEDINIIPVNVSSGSFYAYDFPEHKVITYSASTTYQILKHCRMLSIFNKI